jgi:hypothetical protein
MSGCWTTLPLGLAVTAALVAGACRPVTDAWMTGWTTTQANDRIMLVRKEPRTLGYQRLVSQSGVYPDLGEFLRFRGEPDFLAETTSSNRHFLILYYLDDRTAFACRAKAPSTRSIEFDGPHPITEREYRVLGDLKRQAADRAGKAMR